MPITGKMSAQHKAKIGESQRARWAKAKAYTYDMDEFDMIMPMSRILERINTRARDGWTHEQTIVKNGVFVMYRKGG